MDNVNSIYFLRDFLSWNTLNPFKLFWCALFSLTTLFKSRNRRTVLDKALPSQNANRIIKTLHDTFCSVGFEKKSRMTV